MITHLCFCCDSFQCSCMRTVARLFLRVSSISARRSGRDLPFGLCLKYIPSWHSLCLSCVVIASAAVIAVVLIASIAIWIPDIFMFFFYRETGNWRFTGSEIRGFSASWEEEALLPTVANSLSKGGTQPSFRPPEICTQTQRHVSNEENRLFLLRHEVSTPRPISK